MPYYKFIKPDIVNLKRWIDGKIFFSKIPDLNDDSEKCATVNLAEVEKSLKNILQNGLTLKDISNLEEQEKLLCRIFPDRKTEIEGRLSWVKNLKGRKYEDFEDRVKKIIDRIAEHQHRNTRKNGYFLCFYKSRILSYVGSLCRQC